MLLYTLWSGRSDSSRAPHSVTPGKFRGGMTIFISSSLFLSPPPPPPRRVLGCGCGCPRLNAHERHSSGLSLGDISVRSHGKSWRFPRLFQVFNSPVKQSFSSCHGQSYFIMATKAQDSNVANLMSLIGHLDASRGLLGDSVKGCASLFPPPPPE